jgi:hypothetical protein
MKPASVGVKPPGARQQIGLAPQRGIDLALDHPYRTRALLVGDPLGRGLPHGRDDHGDEVTTVQHQTDSLLDGSVWRATAGRRVAHKRADSFPEPSTAVGSLPNRSLAHLEPVSGAPKRKLENGGQRQPL